MSLNCRFSSGVRRTKVTSFPICLTALRIVSTQSGVRRPAGVLALLLAFSLAGIVCGNDSGAGCCGSCSLDVLKKDECSSSLTMSVVFRRFLFTQEHLLDDRHI